MESLLKLLYMQIPQNKKRKETLSKYIKKTKAQKQINKYVEGYAKRNKITKQEALKRNIVKNVIAWINLREQENKHNNAFNEVSR